MHYLFGSTFRQQVRSLQRYAKDGFYRDTRVDVIISVMVRISSVELKIGMASLSLKNFRRCWV